MIELPVVPTMKYDVIRAIDAIKIPIFHTRHVAALLSGNITRQNIPLVLNEMRCAQPVSLTKPGPTPQEWTIVGEPGSVCEENCNFFKAKNLRTHCPRRERAQLPLYK